jgi:hypothetical protein
LLGGVFQRPTAFLAALDAAAMESSAMDSSTLDSLPIGLFRTGVFSIVVSWVGLHNGSLIRQTMLAQLNGHWLIRKSTSLRSVPLLGRFHC